MMHIYVFMNSPKCAYRLLSLQKIDKICGAEAIFCIYGAHTETGARPMNIRDSMLSKNLNIKNNLIILIK